MMSHARCRMAHGARNSSATPCRAVPIAMCSSTSNPWATKKRALATHRISTCHDPSNSDNPTKMLYLKRDWPLSSRFAVLKVWSSFLAGEVQSFWAAHLLLMEWWSMSIELGIVCIGASIAISLSFAFAAWFERSKTKKDWVDGWLKTVVSHPRAPDHSLGDRTDFVVGSSSIRASFFASFCVRCPRDDHLMLENA